ncbi:MAG: hypothetical protein ACTJHU_06265 [Mycetocola sp.]
MTTQDTTSRPALIALDIVRGAVVHVDVRTGTQTALTTGLTEAPDGVVVDPGEGTVTFTLMGEPDGALTPGAEPPFTTANGSIQRIPLTGGEPQSVVPRGSFTTGKQLARDTSTGQLFWSDREGRGVYRSEADGSDVTRLIDTTGTGPSEVEEWCVGVAVNPEANELYWTQKGGAKAGQGRIFRAPLVPADGQFPIASSQIETLWSGLPEPIDLEIDASTRTLYWTDRGAGATGNTLNRAAIPAAGEAGAAPQVLASGFMEAIGLARDERSSLIYVSDLSGAIREVNPATGQERLVTTLAGAATGIALLAE